MLKRIRLKDFKSFVDEEVEVAPLTLLVGANASGKSNFLDAIRFLQGLSFDLALSEILSGERQSIPSAWPGIRGGAKEAARMGEGAFSMESVWLAPRLGPSSEPNTSELLPNMVEVQHRIVCGTSPYPMLEGETLESESGGGAKLSTVGPRIGDEVKVEQLFAGDLKADASRSLLSFLDNGRARSLAPGNLDILTWWYGALRELSFLDIEPSKMRDYGRRGYPLGHDGRNLSGVLADLCERDGDREGLINWLVEFCAPDIKSIDFEEVEALGDIMAMFVEKGDKRISARSISDGTLHFLGTLLALRTAEPGSVILIEEIEAGLHPTRIRLLVEYLEMVTRERDIQVIATTHSPVVLQWLSDEALRNTIVFGRVPDHEGTIMRRLGDLPHFNEVVERTGIEEMFTTGWLEMAL
ncbi:MAG TPA: AAA family ATPase [Thermoanaerobaculia bacterium]|nr:AAA family ATPase [Thermoanaerobaculia bacterium]